jgi:large subunit ribosomal protein L21
MYAVVKVGGKQYRVEKGESLLVDRMNDTAEGDKLTLDPLLLADGKETVFEGGDLGKIKVEAVVTRHERGPKIHVLKYKPKRGYKRRTGHRSDLTRIEIKDIKLLQRASPAVKEAKEAEETPKAEAAQAETKPKAPAKPRASAAKPKAEAAAKKPAAKKPAAKKPAAKPRTTEKEAEDGS